MSHSLRLFRSALAAFMFALVSAAPSHAAPVLVMQPGTGVDVNNLTVGQIFQVDVVITGINGEIFAGGGGGGFSGDPLISFLGAVIGTIGSPLDGTDVLFELTLQALGAGTGFIGTTGSSITTNVGSYTGLSSGPLGFTIRAAAVSEPGSVALSLLALAGLAAANRRRAPKHA